MSADQGAARHDFGGTAWRSALVTLVAVGLGFALAPRLRRGAAYPATTAPPAAMTDAAALSAGGPRPRSGIRGAELSAPTSSESATGLGPRDTGAGRSRGDAYGTAGPPGGRPPGAVQGVTQAGGAPGDAQTEARAGDWDPAAPCGARVPGSVTATAAEGAVGTFQGVEFRVAGTKDTGRVTFLNSHDPYRGHFYVAVFPDDYDAFPSPPASHFAGRCVVVQGTVELYNGTAQIVLQHPSDIVIVGD